MESSAEFFNGLLKDFEQLFKEKKITIIECKDNTTGKIIHAIAATRVDPASKLLEFIPVAVLWDKNPTQSMSITDNPVLAIQKSVDDWAREADAMQCDPMILN
jgi:hypothetical protein